MAQFLNIGFNNMVPIGKIIAIVHPEGAVNKRNLAKAKESLRLIDATQGRKTRALIYTEEYIILSSLQPETITGRVEGE